MLHLWWMMKYMNEVMRKHYIKCKCIYHWHFSSQKIKLYANATRKSRCTRKLQKCNKWRDDGIISAWSNFVLSVMIIGFLWFRAIFKVFQVMIIIIFVHLLTTAIDWEFHSSHLKKSVLNSTMLQKINCYY